MIICYTVPEIWHVTDAIFIFHLGYLLPSDKWKSQKNEKKKCLGISSLYTNVPKIMIHFGLFFALLPPNSSKNENFTKMKNTPGDIIILHKCTKNHDHILYYTVTEIWHMTDVIVGSFHVKSPKPPYLNPMDFVEILSGECIHQEMKILKMLSLYHVRFRNYDHLKYGTFSLDTEPSKFLAFSNCFYLAAIFNRKQLKFGLAIHFHTIISKTMYLTKNFIKKVCGGV